MVKNCAVLKFQHLKVALQKIKDCAVFQFQHLKVALYNAQGQRFFAILIFKSRPL